MKHRWRLCLGIAVVSFGCSHEIGPESKPEATHVPTPVGSDSDRFFREFFSNAVTIGADVRGARPILLIPKCFGPVSGVAVTSPDLEKSFWRIDATDDQSGAPAPSRVEVGAEIDGFVTAVPWEDGSPASGIVAVTGPENIGFTMLDKVSEFLPPGDCPPK